MKGNYGIWISSSKISLADSLDDSEGRLIMWKKLLSDIRKIEEKYVDALNAR